MSWPLGEVWCMAHEGLAGGSRWFFQAVVEHAQELRSLIGLAGPASRRLCAAIGTGWPTRPCSRNAERGR